MIYVLQVTPGAEMKVRAGLVREGIAAYVPRRELIIRRSGGWSKVIDVLFPCYVFPDCDYCAELHHLAKAVPDVIGWLGRPTPVIGEEERFMRLMINGGVPIPESTAVVDSERRVTVTGGWLLDNVKFVRGWNIRKKRALLEIYFGGRVHKTSVGVEFSLMPHTKA